MTTWHRIRLATSAGAVTLVAVLAGGTGLLLERTERAAQAASEASLERSVRAVENSVNRQLLQVDAALASLPTLFAGAAPSDGIKPVPAERILRGLNFQTFAFRDLTLVGADGTTWASTRPRGAKASFPPDLAESGRRHEAGSSAILGPVANRVTGDWSLFVARTVAMPGAGDLLALAEVPLPILMRILSETGIGPGVRMALKRRDGCLVASLPLSEIRPGHVAGHAPDMAHLDGRAIETTDGAGVRTLVVARPSLYPDIVVELSIARDVALADWRRDRNRLLIAALTGALLISAFTAALLAALRHLEKADTERVRASTVLENALEAMSDGFVMWDESDRLVTTNRRYRELYTRIAPFLVKGARLEDVVRRGAEAGQYPDAIGRVDAFVDETVSAHRTGRGNSERLVAGGHWLLATDRRTADGCTVGIRTDITPMKTALAELAVANDRANEAAEEAIRQNAVLTEREGRISFLAHHDDLTGLPNRVLFRNQMETVLADARESGDRVALLYLDLDRFKDVNDTLGHSVGDALLRAVADRLLACAGGRDVVARLGGDEFAILSASPDQPAAARTLSARIVDAVRRPFEVAGHAVATGVSIGIAVASESDPDTLLKQADVALYEAKASGRGTVRVFAHEMSTRLSERLEIEADLLTALADGQFALAYQPIYDLDAGELAGVEALLRWTHPARGSVSPALFIPIAEEMGLITEIGAWVLGQACRDVATLPGDLRVAVNLSPVQIASDVIVATVRDAIENAGLSPHRLELEITETALLSSDQRNRAVLEDLHDLGTRIVLDDFGTGYSSLSHLRLYPLDKIKIDRSFVRDMAERDDCHAIVTALAHLAAQLGMITTAEGVETAEQLALVHEAGCTQAQGYLLGKPQTILQLVDTIARGRSPAPDAMQPERLGRDVSVAA